jgi:hypothetical protein
LVCNACPFRLADIGRLPRLERLHANSVRVTDVGMAHLAGLTKLRSLGIEGTPGLTDAGLAHLAGLEQLEGLMIQGTMGIEGPGLAHLAGLKRLGFLMIDTRDKGVRNRFSVSVSDPFLRPASPVQQ